MQPTEILKWVGIVLAAGFVGYFGRYLAIVIIERTRRKQAEQEPTAAKDSAGNRHDSHGEAELKVEKKRAKAEVKRSKKQEKEASG